MGEKKNSDHWDSLALNLGASPQESEPLPPKDVESGTEEGSAGEAASRPPKPPKAKKPKRRPAQPSNSWESLAGNLGIEVPQPEPSPSAPVEDDLDEPELVESTPESISPIEEVMSEQSVPASEEVADLAEDFADEALVLPDPSELPEPSQPKAAFDSLFATEPAETDGFETAEELLESDRLSDVDQAPGEIAEESSEMPSEGDELEKKSRRRRRRRRKPPRQDEAEAEDAEPLETETAEDGVEEEVRVGTEAEEETSSEEPRTKRKRRRRGSRRKTESESVAAEADQAQDSSDDEGGENIDRVQHQGIPTWDDAVGVLIDANMASRGGKGSGGGSRSRGGRRRGRGDKPSDRNRR